jgi:glycine/D-amino acid oxidase-like deaminating enzyme
MTGAFDVIIVGAGVTGLFTALKLLRLGYSVGMIDEFPVGGYASTRNQGWLLGGAMFTGAGDDETVRACRFGGGELRREFPEVVDDAIRTFYFFSDDVARGRFLADFARVGVDATTLTATEVVREEPHIAGSAFTSFAELQDRRVDTSRLLLRLLDEVVRLGGILLERPSGVSPAVTEKNGGYEVKAGDHEVFGAALVSASGAATPVGAPAGDLLPRVSEYVALTVALPLVRNIVAGPYVTSGANIVPYLDGRLSGFTVTLTGYSSRHSEQEFRLRYCESLQDLFPTLIQRLDGKAVACSIYRCKTRHCDAFPRWFMAQVARNHFVALTMKMTLAPHVSDLCARAVADAVPHAYNAPVGSEPRVPSVAQRRSLHASTHTLTSDGGKLEIA